MTPRLGIGLAVGVLAVVAATLAPGCDESAGGDAFERELITSWVQGYARPTHAALVGDAEALSARAAVFCAAPTAATLTEARDAWQQARGRWSQLAPLRFGPASAFPARLGSNIDFGVLRAEAVVDVLAGDGPLTAADVAAAGAAARGLPAIEALLYPEDDALAAFAATPRRCAYLTAAAEDLVTLTAALAAAWGPYGDAMIAGAAPFEGRDDVVDMMVAELGFTLEVLRKEHLARPLGLTTDGQAQPGKVISAASGRSLQNVRDALDGVSILVRGDAEREVLGLVRLARVAERPDLVQTLSEQLQAADAALAAVGVPLTEALSADRAAVEDAFAALGSLQRTLQTDLPQALGASIGFGGGDGD
ncbi:MAG: imelysin family protein [Myxococcales bacterium]|nr:imelysin family protein [Myxococcales bacterium]